MTLQEFFAMGGHGFYIWSSYGIGAVVFIGLFVGVKMQRNSLIKQLRRRYRHESNIQSESTK